jgi:sugar phosphate isomerase/epimerase
VRTLGGEREEGIQIVTALRIAAQTRAFAQPFKKALHTVAAIGCDGVQFDARNEVRPPELSETGLRQLLKMLDDLNLRVGSLIFPTRRGYADPIDLDRRVEATVAALKLASELKSRVLVCDLGRIPAIESTDMGTLSEVVISLGNHGMRLGVQLAAQVRFENFEQVAGFIATLPEGSLFLDLHPARLLAEGHSPLEFVAELGQHIAHLHAVDAVRDFSSGRNLEVELGRGSVDFPALLGQLEEFEYRGWATIERQNSEQVLDDIANAVKFLRAV